MPRFQNWKELDFAAATWRPENRRNVDSISTFAGSLVEPESEGIWWLHCIGPTLALQFLFSAFQLAMQQCSATSCKNFPPYYLALINSRAHILNSCAILCARAITREKKLQRARNISSALKITCVSYSVTLSIIYRLSILKTKLKYVLWVNIRKLPQGKNQDHDEISELRHSLLWLRNNKLSVRQEFYRKKFSGSTNTTIMISKFILGLSLTIFLSFMLASYTGK